MAVDDPTAAALAWLLASDEPAVRHLARRDLLGDPEGSGEPQGGAQVNQEREAAAGDAARVLEGPKVAALLAGQQPDGGFGVRPYSKWTGAHWRLVSLVELAAPAGEPRLLAAARRSTSRCRRPGSCTSTGWTRARPGPGRRPSGPPSCSCPTGCSARCGTAR
jgi:hypothetical protein